MFKEITDVFTWLNNAGVFAFLMVLIPAVYKLVKPVLTHKVQTEKNVHVKQGLEVGLNLANTFVPEMATMAGLSKSDRKKEVMRLVQKELVDNGVDLDTTVISGLVEQAYQDYKVSGGDNHSVVAEPAETDADVESEDVEEPVQEQDPDTITVDPMEAQALGADESIVANPTPVQTVETPETPEVATVPEEK